MRTRFAADQGDPHPGLVVELVPLLIYSRAPAAAAAVQPWGGSAAAPAHFKDVAGCFVIGRRRHAKGGGGRAASGSNRSPRDAIARFAGYIKGCLSRTGSQERQGPRRGPTKKKGGNAGLRAPRCPTKSTT